MGNGGLRPRMQGLDLLTALRLEKARAAWEFATLEHQLHEHRFVQLMALCLTLALTALASVVLEKVPALPGLWTAGAMGTGAGYAHVRLLLLPKRLRRAGSVRRRTIQRLIAAREG